MKITLTVVAVLISFQLTPSAQMAFEVASVKENKTEIFVVDRLDAVKNAHRPRATANAEEKERVEQIQRANCEGAEQDRLGDREGFQPADFSARCERRHTCSRGSHEPIIDMMSESKPLDCYELLQVNPNAEVDTIHRVYRLLAQRFHPDNNETGNDARFREIHEAYVTLSDPDKRAKYDIQYHQQKQDRWRLVSTGAKAEDDFEIEQINRLTVLEALHAKRRLEPEGSGMPLRELESLTGRPREHLQFTIWYLAQKKLVQRDDSSQLLITADGVDFLEQNFRTNVQRRRLKAPSDTA